MKRLYKSRSDKMIFGVCAGLARYFEVDVVLVRLLFVLGLVMGGWGLPAYIVAAIVIPEEPKGECTKQQAPAPQDTLEQRFEGPVEQMDGGNGGTTGPQLFGYVLILVGAYFLARQFMPAWLWSHLWWFRLDKLWPLVFVAIGVAILVRRSAK